MSTIYKKLLNIQNELKAPKGQYNSFGKYSYRSCEDILEALKPLLLKNNSTIIITDKIINISDRFYLEATITFIDVETGESISNSALAREEESKKGADSSQVTGSTSSYARKYALNGMFCIDDTKDSDATNTHGKENNTQQGKGNLSDNQIKRLYAIGNKAGIVPADILKVCMNDFKVKKVEELTKPQYDQICSRLESKIK